MLPKLYLLSRFKIVLQSSYIMPLLQAAEDKEVRKWNTPTKP